MRDDVRAALDGLVAALEAHAEAAMAVARPDIPDPLPQASRDLVAAVHTYRSVLDHWTGAHVPLAVAEAPDTMRTESQPGSVDGDVADDAPPPHADGLDWAGDAEQWR